MSQANDSGIDALIAAARATYAATLPSRVSEVMALAAKSNWTEVRRAAHKLRGSAATYGFAELGVAIGAIEDAILAAQGTPDENTCARIQAALAGAAAAAQTAFADPEEALESPR